MVLTTPLPSRVLSDQGVVFAEDQVDGPDQGGSVGGAVEQGDHGLFVRIGAVTAAEAQGPQPADGVARFSGATSKVRYRQSRS